MTHALDGQVDRVRYGARRVLTAGGRNQWIIDAVDDKCRDRDVCKACAPVSSDRHGSDLPRSASRIVATPYFINALIPKNWIVHNWSFPR